MRTMIIFLVFVLHSAIQLLFAQNLTLEVRDVENANGKMDTAAFGLPTEKFGFSNDAEGVMGPPSYEKCSFTFAEDMTLVIHLK